MVMITLVLLCTETHHVVCDRFYILTSSNNTQCPGQLTGEPCLTLQQFANSPDSNLNVSLVMEAGIHTLDSQHSLSLSNIHSFSMVPLVPDSHVRVTCSTPQDTVRSPRFRFTSISYVQIQGVSFESCKDDAFSNTGMEIRNIFNSIQFYNVSFTNFDSVSIEAVESAQIQVKDISFSQGRRFGVGPAGEFSIENSHFQQSSESALLLSGIIKATVMGCQFNSNSRNRMDGGALNILSSSVLINGSIFDNNSADTGGAIHAEASNVTVDGNTFTNNSAIFAGAAINVNNVTFTVIDSIFSSNRALIGAAISAYSSPSILIIASSFADNAASSFIPGRAVGGALSIELCTTTSILNSSFHNNRASGGGAIWNREGNEFFIADCLFSSNTASLLSGGAIRALNTPYINVVRSTFDSNVAGTWGGVISTTTLKIFKQFPLQLILSTNCNFINNRAGESGGAIYVDVNTNLTASVSNGYFKNNTASNGTGGVMFYDGWNTNISLDDSTFEYNSATSCGVLDTNDFHHHSVGIFSSMFSYNIATIGGGVVCANDASISVEDSTFSHNSAVLHAGVMYVDNSILKVERSVFVNNSADSDGGVVYANSTNYTVRLSSFVDNTAGDSGGVMLVGGADSWVSMERSSCGHNSAGNRGGVIAIIGSNLVIDETNVFNNTARLGGAVSACNSNVTLSSELAETEDLTSSVCTLYDGFINRFNVSEFIQQERSTITSMPVTTTTSMASPTTNSSTTQILSTTQISTLSTTQSPNTTQNVSVTQREPSTTDSRTLNTSNSTSTHSDFSSVIPTSMEDSGSPHQPEKGSHSSAFPSVLPLFVALLVLQFVLVF